MNCYLFLDIDGVLNSMRTLVAFRGTDESKFDHVAVKLLDVLCVALTDAGLTPKVVISSTWRIEHPDVAWWNELFTHRFGCTAVSVVGVTGKDNTVGLRNRRGHEVATWLADRWEETHERAYACLDDSTDYFLGQPLVKVDPDYGLSFCNVTLAYTLITGKAFPPRFSLLLGR